MDRILSKLIWLIIIGPAFYLLAIYNQIPETIPTHYDVNGVPDRYGNKSELWFMTALIVFVNIAVYLLLTNVYRIDPKRTAVLNKDSLRRMAFAISLFMSGILAFLIYNHSNNNPNFLPRFIFVASGFLFSIMGNYMHNLRPNYFAGLRLPWTLENEENWRKTHAMAGKYWFWGGLVIGITCLFVPTLAAIVVMFSVTMIMTIIPGVYSYKLYRKQKAEGHLNKK
jgi:uncharacterized membrane protein